MNISPWVDPKVVSDILHQMAQGQNSKQTPKPDFGNLGEKRAERSPMFKAGDPKERVPPEKIYPELSGFHVNAHSGETRLGVAKKRADYRVKFGILREAYPNMEIPEIREDQSIEEIEVIYKEYIKRIHIDSSVEQNKIYLLILWLIIEIIGGRFLNLPFAGYTKNQFIHINKYHMLLVELGERSYVEGAGNGWPIEFRILMLSGFNAVIFVLVQLLAKKIGVDGSKADSMAEELREMINQYLTQNKGNETLRRAEQATSDVPPPPPVETSSSLGDLGDLVSKLAPFFVNLVSSSNKTRNKPEVRRPTTFGAKKTREAKASEKN